MLDKPLHGFGLDVYYYRFRGDGTGTHYQFVPLSGNKNFYDIPMRYVGSVANDANSPSMAQWHLFGTSGPEIAGCLMGISRSSNSLPKSQIDRVFPFYAS